MPLIKERLHFLCDSAEMVRFLFTEPPVPPTEQIIPKKLDAAKTKEVLDKKAHLYKHPKTTDVKFRETKNGITTINGEVRAKRTEEILPNGDKKITVDYGKSRGQKIITISKDGTRTEDNSKLSRLIRF